MKLIGKFRDFYDNVQGLGHDETVMYHRKGLELNFQEFVNTFPNLKSLINTECRRNAVHTDFFWKSSIVNEYGYFGLSKLDKVSDDKLLKNVFIGKLIFCGKIYTYAEVTRGDGLGRGSRYFFYSFESLNKFLKLKDEEKFWAKSRGGWYNLAAPELNGKQIDELMSNQGSTEFEKEFINEKIVTLVPHDAIDLRRGPHLILEGNLSKFEFFKIFTPQQAYQEIEMYIGGKLGLEGKPMVEIEDKYRIPQHGFDKRSFRKEPTKRKP